MSSSPNFRLQAHVPSHHGRTRRPVFLPPSRTTHKPARSHRDSTSWRTRQAISWFQARLKSAWIHPARRFTRSDSTANSHLDAGLSCRSFPLSLILSASLRFDVILLYQTPAFLFPSHTHFHNRVDHSLHKPKFSNKFPTFALLSSSP
jgi:hypothetical protein